MDSVLGSLIDFVGFAKLDDTFGNCWNHISMPVTNLDQSLTKSTNIYNKLLKSHTFIFIVNLSHLRR